MVPIVSTGQQIGAPSTESETSPFNIFGVLTWVQGITEDMSPMPGDGTNDGRPNGMPFEGSGFLCDLDPF